MRSVSIMVHADSAHELELAALEEAQGFFGEGVPMRVGDYAASLDRFGAGNGGRFYASITVHEDRPEVKSHAEQSRGFDGPTL